MHNFSYDRALFLNSRYLQQETAMSTPEIFQQDVLFYQRLLKSLGFYTSTLDADWGPKTEAADRRFVQLTADIANELGRFDSRTEGHIATLHPAAQRLARRFMTDLESAGYDKQVKIIQSSRTFLQQDALYALGRTKPGQKVTNARGGQSNHNFAIAWDIGIFDGPEYLDGDTSAELAEYDKVAEIVNLDGLVWGGNWTSLRDRPHYQLDNGRTTSQTRPLFMAGQDYVSKP
jgi:peptidoglycan L-alanyl-D-glutamate endopeptidase CwlK